MEHLWQAQAALVDWLADGLLHAAGWQVLVYTLAVTHLTIASVTIYLHRSQAHRSLDLHPAVAHVFRFWLWLTTGMVTREWVAIHRKHHAKCETPDDPHSPQTRGLKKVLAEGAELYRAEAKVGATIVKYGHGAPDDWIERRLYSRWSAAGIVLMLAVDVLLFGAIGLTVWAVQMAWIPIWAAGVVNGLGHWAGYRNFEAKDASTNLTPWGIVIGGEELHNNHHTYPTSAKFSVKRYEFDIGWLYIRVLSGLGLATVRKTPPRLRLGSVVKPVADDQTLEAVIANRYEVMARYAAGVKAAVAAEVARLKAQGAGNAARLRDLRLAKAWLHRDDDRIPSAVKPTLAQVVRESPQLAKLVAMREELRALWTRTNVSAEQLVADLQTWCRKAEESGIQALQELSLRLRAA